MRSMTKGLWLLFVLVPGVAGGWMLRSLAPDDGARLFAQVVQIVGEDALEGLAEDRLYQDAARGLVERLEDDYAALYSPEELAAFTRDDLGGPYGGLGMQIEDQQGLATVTRVFPNTPAERGGVRAGDRVVAVNGESVRGARLDTVSGRLLGRPGTDVVVSFQRAGVSEPITGTFTRAVVHVPAVPYGILLDGGIGYIPLQRFNDGATDEVRAAVERLRAAGARGFVLDVRGNGGGSLDEALTITNVFVPAGAEIATVRYRERRPDVYTARTRPLLADAPLVVLTDGYSASASEIVAGALQDHDRALVVGTTSFGKGLVQQIYTLDSGWALKLTTGQWFTPSGRTIQRDRDTGSEPAAAVSAAAGSSGGVEVEGLAAGSSGGVEVGELALADRPTFRSTGGRVVYGGGGITPDLSVRPDTLTTPEQEFLTSLGAKSQQVYLSVYDLALELKEQVQGDFQVQPAWRDQLFARLVAAEVPLTRAQFDAARPLLDRTLEQRVAGLAFGDSASFRRYSRHDAALRTAVELLEQGRTQSDLFALAERRNADRSED